MSGVDKHIDYRKHAENNGRDSIGRKKGDVDF
jgi:hypothetical protein